MAHFGPLFSANYLYMTFQDLKLIEPIQRALQTAGYEHPTPIQAQAVPPALLGRDLLACAQTGTGKTAAFTLPILQLLQQSVSAQAAQRKPRALILAPTRELAIQIGESIDSYSQFLSLKHTVIFGGVSQKIQVRKLQSGVDILTATPGRLLDLMGQGFIRLDDIEFFVLDEADRMLDMGFINDIRKVIRALPTKRQTFFFSATLPSKIQVLAREILTDPVSVQVDPVSSTAERVGQSVYFVPKNRKRNLLLHLLREEDIPEALVFSRTKHGANRIVRELTKKGITAEAIHGNKSQGARQQALKNFKNRKTRVLVATDIAARGIDIEELSHVINYDLPNVSETYVHRIGRTGRAGFSGVALSFSDQEERAYLRDIEKLIGKSIEVIAGHPFESGSNEEPKPSQSAPKQGRPGSKPKRKNNRNKRRWTGSKGRSSNNSDAR